MTSASVAPSASQLLPQRETIYLTDWERFGAGAEIRKKYYDDAGAAYPSAVGQEVVSLAVPGLVMEVQMVAYIGETKKVGE